MSKANDLFERRQRRVRVKVRTNGGGRVRLSVFRSGRHIYAQVIDDGKGMTLAAAQTFPCLELALRERIGIQFSGRVDRKGKPRKPPMLDELLRTAKVQRLISAEVDGLSALRNMFAHGNDAVLNPAMFLAPFELVTFTIQELFAPPDSRNQQLL